MFVNVSLWSPRWGALRGGSYPANREGASKGGGGGEGGSPATLTNMGVRQVWTGLVLCDVGQGTLGFHSLSSDAACLKW